MPYSVKSRLREEGIWVRRVDCRKRVGMSAKGMERKCVVRGVEGLVRPVRGPRWG